MWKHEIIQDNKYLQKTGNFCLSGEWLPILCQAQQFYLGEYADLKKEISKSVLRGDRIFPFHEMNTWGLPYPTTLFSWLNEGIKYAILIHTHNKTALWAQIFTTLEAAGNRWVHLPVTAEIRPDKTDRLLISNGTQLDLSTHMRAHLSLASTACTILNARNVFAASVEHEGMEKRNRKRRKKGQPLLERYHVLKFCPGKIVSKDAIGIGTGENSGSMPVHLCRGHFMTFTPERPMFGRPGLHGRFWVQAHVRGNKKNGVVVKDYEMVAA